MVVNAPRIVESIANDPREMVRVRFSERDTRSYTRLEAEKLLASGGYPDAVIVGDQDVKDAAAGEGERLAGEGATFEEAAEDLKAKAGAKAQRTAPNKARGTSSASSKAGGGQATEAPSTPTGQPPAPATAPAAPPASEARGE